MQSLRVVHTHRAFEIVIGGYPSTTLGYKLDRPANANLVVYDIAKRAVKTLVDQYQFQGQYNIRWESTDEAGLPVPSGTYVVRLQDDDGSATKKMILTE